MLYTQTHMLTHILSLSVMSILACCVTIALEVFDFCSYCEHDFWLLLNVYSLLNSADLTLLMKRDSEVED